MKRSRKMFYIMMFCCLAGIWGCHSRLTESEGWQEKEERDDEKEALSQSKGYNLPIDEKVRAECEADCRKVMEMIRPIYERAATDGSKNLLISEEEAEEMCRTIGQSGYLATMRWKRYSMDHYEKMEQFLKQASAGEETCEIVIYLVRENGAVVRQKFIYDGGDMYVLDAFAVWNGETEPVIANVTYTRLNQWEYTEKGWFSYEYCVPQPPEVTEMICGNNLLRVKPFKEEYLEIGKICLEPVSYLGNNLFHCSWDSEHMEKLDYAGLFEYFYKMEYGETFPEKQYADGIPKKLFEDLITGYLPVEAGQLKEYAIFNQEKGTYEWNSLGVGSFYPSAIGGAWPEVTKVDENPDGSLTLTVDAVSETNGDDKWMTHKVTVLLSPDQKVRYLSNQVDEEDRNKDSGYVYRVR